MTTNSKIIIGILSVSLVIAILLGGIAVNKTLNYTKEVRKHYESELSKLSKRLEQNESIRQRLDQDGRILRDRYIDLRRQDSILNQQLDSIRGKFEHLTPTQLQEAMITEHKRFVRK